VAALVQAMLGPAQRPPDRPQGTVAVDRPLATEHPPAAPPNPGALRLCGVTVPGRLASVSLHAGRNEIVGIAGLAGSGHRDVLAVAAGVLRPAAGHVELPDGTRLRPGVRGAVCRGVGLVPGDRRRLGLMLDKPLWENVAQVRAVGAARERLPLRASRLRALARHHLRRLRVGYASVDDPADRLSGGNQQKVVFAKWLAAQPQVLLLDDATRGVDVGAKAEIHALLRELAAAGVVQLLVSSEPQELADVCDRVVVIHRGRVHAELRRPDLSAHGVLAAMNGEAA
jgi:ABC-type sugar transport system ATPase subunit